MPFTLIPLLNRQHSGLCKAGKPKEFPTREAAKIYAMEHGIHEFMISPVSRTEGEQFNIAAIGVVL